MCASFCEIENKVPPPVKISRLNLFVFRYEEESIEQCIVSKLARILTGIRTTITLNKKGFIQEQALMHRVLDELGEDITFLCYAVLSDEQTELHKRYLKAFFMEDFDDHKNPMTSRTNRPMIQRKKIRAYISRIEETELNPSTGVAVSKTLSQVYSGFVHAAAPQIMELYGGNPPRFHVHGMLGTPRVMEYREDLKNYVYRSLINLMLVALSFHMKEMVEELYKYRNEFEKNIGFDYLQRDNDP